MLLHLQGCGDHLLSMSHFSGPSSLKKTDSFSPVWLSTAKSSSGRGGTSWAPPLCMLGFGLVGLIYVGYECSFAIISSCVQLLMSNNYCFSEDIYSLGLLRCFWPFFHGDPWLIHGDDIDVPFSPLYSTCLPAKGLCINHYLLQKKEASLIRDERYNNLWV